MTDTNFLFNQWFSSRFGSLGDETISAAFRKVARAAWEQGVRVGRDNAHSDTNIGHRTPGRTYSSQFEDTDLQDRPGAHRSHPTPRSNSQFDDTSYIGRPDANVSSTPVRTATQFDDNNIVRY